jgi:DNA polymerase III delta prime subunit
MTSHHAVLLSEELPLIFECETPVHVAYREPQFTIDMVRTLIQTAHRRPQGDGEEQVVLVATEFITEEAQQALLKVIEEPPVSTKFIFVLPEGYSLLPTLESRFDRQKNVGSAVDTSTFETFLRYSYAERIAVIEESAKKKDQAWQAAIKRGLLTYLRTETTLSYDALKDLEYVARLLLTRGASNKFLLEHLALTLPA